MRCLNRLIVTALTLTATGAALADGGWTTQQIDLAEGWNLVWLDVEPATADNQPATVFGPNAISVCGFVPGRAIGDRGAWRNYHASHPAFASGLMHVQGDRGYFVLASVDETIAVTGRPLRRSRPQSAGAPALFGASSTFREPSFAEYFAIGDAIDRITEVNRFDSMAALPEDDFESLLNPGFIAIAQNVAYWVTTDVYQKYAGPLRVNSGAGGLQFGKNQYALDMTIEVPLGGATVTIDVLDSAAPPAGEATDASSGDTSWLQYRDEDGDWQSFTSAFVVTVDPSETTAVVVLRANRKEMAPALELDGSLYQALIEVTDDVGHREVIGAGMEVIGGTTGTWMGDITLDTVSLNPGLTQPDTGTNAAEPMRFGLLLEIPEVGTARILDRICMPVDATYTYDTEGELEGVDTYDRFTTFRSVMFPEPIDLDGNLEGSMALAANHPLNPYRHRYNPEHVNGYAITRAIHIEITTEDPAPVNIFLGDMLSERTGNNVLVGTYTETITGLRPGIETIVVSGTFRLVRLSEDTGLRECPQ